MAITRGAGDELRRARAMLGQAVWAVASARHQYPGRNPDLTVISLRVFELACSMMARSRYGGILACEVKGRSELSAVR
jgi:hypothetical protein